jgi:hypothetical protein
LPDGLAFRISASNNVHRALNLEMPMFVTFGDFGRLNHAHPLRWWSRVVPEQVHGGWTLPPQGRADDLHQRPLSTLLTFHALLGSPSNFR